MSEPALPWAQDVEKKDTPEHANDPSETKKAENDTYLTLETAGVPVDSRIEVKWQVEPDDGEPFMRWWGARIVGPSDQQDAEHPGAPVYEIAYDAQDGFEQERAHIIFTGEHELLQLDVGDELSWRREGDTWEVEEESEDEDGGDGVEAQEAENGDGIVTMQHLKQMVANEKEYLGGKSLEEVEGEMLQSLEPSKRIAVAAGFRDFADGLIDFLQSQVAASSDGSVTVTEDHVRAFMEGMQKRQRTR